jgi:hypothetical protein
LQFAEENPKHDPRDPPKRVWRFARSPPRHSPGVFGPAETVLTAYDRLTDKGSAKATE